MQKILYKQLWQSLISLKLVAFYIVFSFYNKIKLAFIVTTHNEI